jgi:rod shape-determining protein MreD
MLNVSVMPFIEVLGVSPNLILIFAACWTVIRGQDEGMIVVPMAGFISGLTTSEPLGASVLALAPIVLLAGVIRLQALESDFLPTIGTVLAGSVTYTLISSVILALSGQSVDWAHLMIYVLVPSAIVNALFAPIVYLPVHWLSPTPDTTVMGPGRITFPL